MRRISVYFLFSLLLLGLPATTPAQDMIVPAGTLLHCTLDEPNFSSATADIGDPVICHLSSLREFGVDVFPRGSYLGGHLEEDKEPGRLVGKGFLKIEFDRIGFPASDIPVPSKVIAAKGFKVDRHGDILGRGHATRDTVEWLFPPLWPYKLLTLPLRGPRPALKGEEQITLRLMEDIQVPRPAGAAQFNRPASYDRPPAVFRRQLFDQPPPGSTSPARQPATINGTANTAVPALRNASQNAPAVENSANASASLSTPEEPGAGTQRPAARMRAIALKSDKVYSVCRYSIDDRSLNYVLTNGVHGSVDLAEVDWRKTSRLNTHPVAAQPVAAVTTASNISPRN